MNNDTSIDAYKEHIKSCKECQQSLTGVTSALEISRLAKSHGFELNAEELKEHLAVESQKPLTANTSTKTGESSPPIHCYVCSGYKLWSCGFLCSGGMVSIDD